MKSPFAHPRPPVRWTPRRIKHISDILSLTYGDPRHYNKRDPIDELIFIVLSAKTSERSYRTTYDALRREFRPWFKILEHESTEVVEILAVGGLQVKKEEQIRKILTRIKERFGTRGLSELHNRPTDDVEDILTSLPGVGLKSARCVAMYALGREVFPVDTHVRRVLNRLGLIEKSRLTERVQNSIQEKIPPPIRYKLHVNLVAHGRKICTARNPACPVCPIRRWCEYAKSRL